MTETHPVWNRPVLTALATADEAEGKLNFFPTETVTSPSTLGPS